MLKKLFVSIFVIMAASSSYVNSQSIEEDPIVAVYRWYNYIDGDHIIVADGELSDGTLNQWKYRNKTLSFWAYLKPAEGRLAVYRWYNQKENDWITVAEDEFTDGEMVIKGYSEKALQFYVPIKRSGDLTVSVYRWYNPKTGDWKTVSDGEGNSDPLYKAGWRLKTFSFFGLSRSY